MDWIKFTKQQPPQGEMVTVRFKNNKEVQGKLNGNFMVYAPKDITANELIAGEKDWHKN